MPERTATKNLADNYLTDADRRMVCGEFEMYKAK
jgi:hypothetical protein